MIEAEVSEEHSAFHKGGPNGGETKPNHENNFSQQENEGQNPNDMLLEEETPMKKLIKALKQARAEKDAREAEEKEKLLQEEAIKDLQSPLRKSKTIAFGLITVAD